MVFSRSIGLPEMATPPAAPPPVTVFPVPFRKKVTFGEGHTIRLVSITRIMLEIEGEDAGTFTVMNNHFTWRGFRIRAMVEKGEVVLTLPQELADELGISEAALVPA